MTGILGGGFDPPHLGHVALAAAAVRHFGLDDLLVSVVADPGHKRSYASAEHRLAMARLAFAGLEASVELEPHSFTVDQLEAGDYDDPIFLIGADQLVDFPTWKEPERVLELARLGVATRPGYRLVKSSDRIEPFELEPLDISSSEIRARVARGESIAELVPPQVADYIEAHGLYRRDRRREPRVQ